MRQRKIVSMICLLVFVASIFTVLASCSHNVSYYAGTYEGSLSNGDYFKLVIENDGIGLGGRIGNGSFLPRSSKFDGKGNFTNVHIDVSLPDFTYYDATLNFTIKEKELSGSFTRYDTGESYTITATKI